MQFHHKHESLQGKNRGNTHIQATDIPRVWCKWITSVAFSGINEKEYEVEGKAGFDGIEEQLFLSIIALSSGGIVQSLFQNCSTLLS